MNILVFQHVAAEHLGRFNALFDEDGVALHTVDFEQGDRIPSLDGFDGLWVLGGPMQVWETNDFPWLIDEMAAIREAVLERHLPYFGLCLGHQLLAQALGGDVGESRTPEVGMLDVHLTGAGQHSALFHGLDTTLTCIQGHGAEVVRAPDGADILASSDACTVQALAINGTAVSLQFHAELTLEMVDDCLDIPAYADAFDALLGSEGTQRFREDIVAYSQRHDRIARTLYSNWMRMASQRQTGTSD